MIKITLVQNNAKLGDKSYIFQNINGLFSQYLK